MTTPSRVAVLMIALVSAAAGCSQRSDEPGADGGYTCRHLDGYERSICETTIPCPSAAACPTHAPVKCAGQWACLSGYCAYQCGPCSGPPSDISSCLVGAAFAACTGPGLPLPQAYCSSAAKRCLWSSTGCAFGDYTILVGPQCSCLGQPCPPMFEPFINHLFMSRGSEPWTREREMNVQVTVDPSAAPTATAVTCSGCSGTCIAGDNPCTMSGLGAVKQMPGTVVIDITAGGLWGWWLEIEADLAAATPVARICRLPMNDAISCTPGKVVCASSGTVTFNQKPASSASTLAGELRASFPDGVTITGTFR